jgi:quercetin 2,3-dioxygenase
VPVCEIQLRALIPILPGYEQKMIPEQEECGVLRLIASRDGREGAVTIHQDVDLYASRRRPGERVKHALADGRHAWPQMVRRRIELNGTGLAAGDGAAVSREGALEAVALEEAEWTRKAASPAAAVAVPCV